MKNKICILLSIAGLAMAMSSCQKEIDLSGYMTREDFEQWYDEQNSSIGKTEIYYQKFRAHFDAVEDVYYAQFIYSDLREYLNSKYRNVLLIYATEGGQGWTLLPIIGDSLWLSYGVSNLGDVYLRYGYNTREKFSSPTRTFNMRAYIIPTDIFEELEESTALKLDSPDEVEKACRKLAEEDSTIIFREEETHVVKPL